MKEWQRILASAGIVLVITLMVVTMLVAVARNARVQTAVVGAVAEELSMGLGAEVSIGTFDYKFPNKLLVKDVLLRDRQNDTLLAVDTLTASMNMWKLVWEDTLCIHKVQLIGGKMDAHMVNDSAMNYRFLIDAFTNSEKKEKTDYSEQKGINLQVKDIELKRLNVRYEDWTGNLPYAEIHLNNITPHLFDAEIERFSCHLTHNDVPLDVKALEAQFIMNDTLFMFPKVHVELPRSEVRIEKFGLNRADAKRLAEVHGDSIARRALFAKTDVSLKINQATFTPSDIQAIFPQCKTMNGNWSLTADLQGRVDSIDAHNLHLKFRDKDLLQGDVLALGLPYMDSLYLKAECQDFSINKATLQDILSNVAGKPVKLPDMLNPLGQMHYKGELSGRLNNLQLKGSFRTAIGSIRTDGHAVAAPDFSELQFDGTLASKRFDLGRMLRDKDLGTIGFTVNTNGQVAEDRPFYGHVDANIDHCTYKQYTYKDIHLLGDFKNHVFTGDVHSGDENIRFDFAGSIDLSTSIPVYDFDLQLAHLRIGQLNLSDKYADSDLRLHASVNMQGGSLDNMQGLIGVDTLHFVNKGKELYMHELVVKAERSSADKSGRSLVITSDYLTAGANGDFHYESLPASIMHYVTEYLPSLLPADKRKEYKKKGNNRISFYVYGRDLDKISDVLELPISIPDQPVIKGNLDDPSGTFLLRGNIPMLTYDKNDIENLTLIIDNQRKQFNTNVSAIVHPSSSSTYSMMGDMKLGMSAHAHQDSLLLNLNWANTEEVHNAGEILTATHFARYNGLPLISAHILPSVILLSDSIWNIEESDITYNASDTIIQIDRFSIGSSYQYVHADGIASCNEDDSIRIEMKDIDLDYLLNSFTSFRNAIYFGGNITGWVTAYGVLASPMFEANAKLKNAKINGKDIGNMYAQATLDREQKRVLIQGDCIDPSIPYAPAAIDTLVSRGVFMKDTLDYNFYDLLSPSIRKSGRHTAHIDGEVSSGKWGLNVFADSLALNFVNYWCEGIVEDIDGRGTGDVRVWSYGNGVQVRVAAKTHDIGLTIPFTGVRYWTSDSILMDSTAIRFPNVKLRDKKGNPGTLNAVISHNGEWEDFRYDVEVEAKHALIMDLPDNGDELYGGQVYGDGHIDIHGTGSECHITANAKTTAGTNFIFSLATANNARNNSFIEYVDHSEQTEEVKEVKQAGGTKIFFSLLLEATPEANAVVLLSKESGDKLQCRGEGNLRLFYSDNDLTLHGRYELQRGTFGFTFQNVIRREFKIAEGSSVTWTGNPETPNVDIKARYGVTASLRDLFGTEASSVTSRGSVPVNCVLNLSQSLSNPTIQFGIELPSSDETVASQVHSIINTDEMLMRQVLYLLVFSRFYTPEYLQNTSNVGLNETYSLLSSTVTGQINSWLGKLTDVVTLGFNFRTDGEGEEASQEYEAQFEIHPVKGLLINGNFGYRYNDISNQPIFGNLDVEYLLTPNGKLRAKAFTHTVDKYSLRQANTVQGVGFVFKHDFNWPERKKKDKNKKVNPEVSDSASTTPPTGTNMIEFISSEK